MSNSLKILISSRSFGKINSGALELLKKNGLKPIINPYGKKLSEDEILNLMQDSIGIIAGTEKITEKIISSNSDLKVISRYGIGIDNIDLKTALTITLILSLYKKITNVDKNLKQNKWKPEIGNMLTDKSVGVLGLGRIGKKLTQFLDPFNVKILAYDLHPDTDFIKENNIKLTNLKTMLSKSDIITIHIPLNEKTKYIIDEEELSLMKEKAILINTARGGLINEQALYDFLKTKKIAGAAIDVFENEPNVGKLKELENIILTPHVATYTIETRKNMELTAVRNIINGLKEADIL